MKRHRAVAIEALHACTGVLCDLHESCARYSFIDGTREPSAYWLGTCVPYGTSEHPGYIDVAFCGPPEPHQFRRTRRDSAAPAPRRPAHELADGLTVA